MTTPASMSIIVFGLKLHNFNQTSILGISLSSEGTSLYKRGATRKSCDTALDAEENSENSSERRVASPFPSPFRRVRSSGH